MSDQNIEELTKDPIITEMASELPEQEKWDTPTFFLHAHSEATFRGISEKYSAEEVDKAIRTVYDNILQRPLGGLRTQ